MEKQLTRQLPLRFGVESVDLPQESLADARELLVELLLIVVTDRRQEKGGCDEREDPTGASRA